MNNNEVLVSVEGVSKKFSRDLKKSLWYGLKDISGAMLGIQPTKELRKSEFWAIKDISFTLRRGECIGLIGHNGAGKSTLLKILNGLIPPDTGRIEMTGRVSALIELGAGFNPILTGRENIYNNGAVLGFSQAEIDNKIDAIIEFSEIADFIDTPVQNYSSGMKVRLGFAVAAQMEPDILIIDEVLAVGDLGFVLKCFNRIDFLLQNTALIFVSHSMPQVARICSQILLMDKGQVKYQGTNVSEGIDQYYSQFKIVNGNLSNSSKASVKSFLINGQKPDLNNYLQINRLSNLVIDVEFRVALEYNTPELYIAFLDKEMRNVAEFIRDDTTQKLINKNGLITIKLTIPEIEFSKGLYSITLGLLKHRGGEILFRQQSIAHFQVIAEHHVWSAFQLQGYLQQIEELE
ncbi:MAG: ABC transporter ATP-binding protein [Methyloprofundus sp.]|nr:ABC transporter ATP-binding protein [Methyloprofundus sp.]